MRFALIFLLLFGSAIAADVKPCVFCEIVAGRRQSEGIVLRTEQVVAFLSIGPRNPGHLLIVPVEHAENFMETPEGTMHAMTDAAKLLAQAIKQTDLSMEGFVLQMNNGKPAGQSVFHAHLHLIPRFNGEPEAQSPQPHVPMAELAPIAAKIRQAVNDLLADA